MSLAACNRTFNRTLVQIKEKAKLIIPREIIKKIDYLHEKVGRDEWSCILVYKIVSGVIENPTSFVLKVEDIILMDVGNATYTEYDYSTEDEYAFDKFTNALENGYKLGHLHSHHSMACFFSGTDTAELHDNAPNHNFYVSLIVNFKNPSEWCAAIATCVDEVKTGTIKRQGKVVTKKRFKGTSGFEVVETENVIDEDIPVNEEKGILYKIDLEIEAEGFAIEENFVKRLSELQEAKKSKFSNMYNFAGMGLGQNFREHHAFPHETNSKIGSFGGATNKSTFQEKAIKKEKEDEFSKAEAQMTIFDAGTPKRFTGCYSAAKVRPFLIDLLGCDSATFVSVGAAVSEFLNNNKNPQMLEYSLGEIEEKFQMKCDHFFKMNGEEIDYCAIAISCTDILTPYKNLDIYKLLSDVFDTYVLPENLVDYNEISKYTGLEFELTEQEPTMVSSVDSKIENAKILVRRFCENEITYLDCKNQLISLGPDSYEVSMLLNEMFVDEHCSMNVNIYLDKVANLFKKEFKDFHC